MLNVWNLDPADDENPDIEVYLPGPSGPPGPNLMDVGSFTVPVVITDTIAAPVHRFQRSFITAATPVNQPVIPDPADNMPWMLMIQVVDGSPITLNDAANLKLSGQWIGSPDSILWLIWDGNTRYVEDHRNEI